MSDVGSHVSKVPSLWLTTTVCQATGKERPHMPRWNRDDSARDHEWEDESEDEDGESDDGDWAEDDDEPTVPCPYCGREIHEEAPRCPYCENYVSAADSPQQRKPWWLIVGVLACLYAVLRWIMG